MGSKRRTWTRMRGSAVVGVPWFREGGGMRPSAIRASLSGRYLSFAEREEIALLRAQGRGVREISGRPGRRRARARGVLAAELFESCADRHRRVAERDARVTVAQRRAASPRSASAGQQQCPAIAALSFDRRSSAAHNSIDPAGESPALGVVRLPR
jgi:hypothetical protein